VKVADFVPAGAAEAATIPVHVWLPIEAATVVVAPLVMFHRRVIVPVTPQVSVALMVAEHEHVGYSVGMPEMRPPVDRDNPAGSDPEAMDHPVVEMVAPLVVVDADSCRPELEL